MRVLAHGGESAWLQAQQLGIDIYRAFGVLLGIKPT